MARPKSNSEEPKPRRPPAKTPEARENQLIALAAELAEDQILKGTASSQVITHFLKLGTTRESLEKQKLQRENALLEARVESLKNAEKLNELFEQAVASMRTYKGEQEPDYDV